jgi:hypothetical protein
VATIDDGTVTITEKETVDGTSVKATTAETEFKTITLVDGKDKTEDNGTTTGDDHVFGTTTVVDGIVTIAVKET